MTAFCIFTTSVYNVVSSGQITPKGVSDKVPGALKTRSSASVNECPEGNNLLNSLLTPWSRVLLEKLTGFQLVKKFPAYY